MQQIKGTVLKARLAFLEQHFGIEDRDRVLASLTETERHDILRSLAISWYPFELGKRLDEAIVTVLGAGEERLFLQLGVASANHNLTGFHRNFLTPGDPHAFLAKAPMIYRLYYETGRREYARVADHEGVLTTFDAETFSMPDCLTIVGWHQRAVEMCGGQNVTVIEEECRARGGAVCRYRVRWQ